MKKLLITFCLIFITNCSTFMYNNAINYEKRKCHYYSIVLYGSGGHIKVYKHVDTVEVAKEGIIIFHIDDRMIISNDKYIIEEMY